MAEIMRKSIVIMPLPRWFLDVFVAWAVLTICAISGGTYLLFSPSSIRQTKINQVLTESNLKILTSVQKNRNFDAFWLLHKTNTEEAIKVNLLARGETFSYNHVSKFRRLSHRSSQWKVLVLTDSNNQPILALAYDCETRSAFYSVDNVGIYKVEIFKNTQWTMVDGQDGRTNYGQFRVDGLSVDWINRNLYWTETASKRIMVSTITLKTTYRELIKLTDVPAGITVNPKRKLLFWCTLGGESDKIEMSDLEGQGRKVLYRIPHTQVNKLYALASDEAGQQIFWTKQHKETIWSASIANLPAGEIAEPVEEHHGETDTSTVIVHHDGMIFWRSVAFRGNRQNPGRSIRVQAKNLESGIVVSLHEEEVQQGDLDAHFAAVTIALATCPAR